jgi:SAM-dependent methyltransferase
MDEPARSGGETAHGLPATGERTVPGLASENYWFRRHERAYRFAARSARGTILDVGSGEGYGAAVLAERGHVTAVELDADAVFHASGRYPKLHLIRGDACHLPFRPGSFDVVVALQTLEHLVCADRFIAQSRELLRPGGVLILTTPNRETFSPSGVVNPFHVYEYTADELEGLLRVHFERLTIRGIHAGARLRLLDLVSRGTVQHRLMATPYEQLPARLRRALERITARHFRLGRARGSLDLLAVAS